MAIVISAVLFLAALLLLVLANLLKHRRGQRLVAQRLQGQMVVWPSPLMNGSAVAFMMPRVAVAV